jgi:DamX protein
MTANNEAILSIDTLMHFGLKQQPFAANAPDAYIYADPALDMPVNAIINYLLSEDHIIVLKGEFGVGKSTNAKKLISKSRGSLHSCLFEATISSSMAEIEHCMLGCWNHATSQRDLSAFICTILQQGIKPALIIDDAHELDTDVLEQLLMLRQGVMEQCGRSFGLVLIAESSIENTLSNLEADLPDISQAHSLVLRPLTREQTAAYVDHRLRIAGLFLANPFSDEDINMLMQEGHGLPGTINPLATQKLERYGQAELHQEQPHRLGWLHNHRVAIAGLILLIVVFGALYALIQGFFSSDTPVSSKQVERVALPPPEPQPLEQEPKLDVSLPKAEEELVIPPPLATVDSESPEPQQEITATESGPASKTVQQRDKQPAVPAAETQLEEEAEPLPAPAPEQKPEPSSAKTATVTPKKPTAKEEQLKTDLEGQKWILQQNPEHFAIQLLAASSTQSVRDFVEDLNLNTTLAYYPRKTKDKTLYILLTAPYKDRQAAEQAIKDFPTSLRRSSPWIRSLKDIQDSIYAQ